MLNKTKGFLGFLIATGCVLIWTSFIPFDPFGTHSHILQDVGIWIIGTGLIGLALVLILLGLNQAIRFRKEPRRVVYRSKRNTRFVAVLTVSLLVVTGFVWVLVPELLAIGTLSPSEVRKHPNKYLGENVTVEGYFFGVTMPSYTENFELEDITSGMISDDKVVEDPTEVIGVIIVGEKGTSVISGAKYRFTGTVEDAGIFGMLYGVMLVVQEVEPA